ncbi:MAG: 1-phosphatidylinositol-3-phosphate 5-kinase [Claussenomyces sp. TS43310]|nr:MAG: 1-phosphatidylinositol-3-phosphate 5-kinase [Claussenomyces sp. TS43310]
MSSNNSLSSVTSPRAERSTLPMDLRSQRGSLTYPTGTSQVKKEQLAHVLDAIHTSASQSETLTTFNEFASPPATSSGIESKGLTSELMQGGLSSLYSRFRGAVNVGKDKSFIPLGKDGADVRDDVPQKSPGTSTLASKDLTVGTTRESSFVATSPVLLSDSSSRLQSPTTSSFDSNSENKNQTQKGSRASLTTSTNRSSSSVRPSIAPFSKAAASSTIAPVNVNAFRDRGRQTDLLKACDGNATTFTDDPPKRQLSKSNAYGTSPRLEDRHAHADLEVSGSDSEPETSIWKTSSSLNHTRSRFEGPSQLPSVDGGSGDVVQASDSVRDAASAISSLKASESLPRFKKNVSASSFLSEVKQPAAIERITQSHLPCYHPSRASSTDRSTAEASPVNTPAHNSVHHGSFSVEQARTKVYVDQRHIPGTTTNEGDPEAVSAKLEQMRKQVLSKEFWMADEICKECFLCGDAFTAFRRKHHCRTCGCIFDSKCTSIISGERFGVQGTLRVCKICLDIINRRHDSSSSDESADDQVLPTSFFQSQQTRSRQGNKEQIQTLEVDDKDDANVIEAASTRPLATPMMAIPATRRIGESTSQRSAVLEIDAAQLVRPGSARSLKSMPVGRPPSSSHRRHHSKHNFLGRFRAVAEQRAPFHREPGDETHKHSHLPAFHDDNIIDPDLAPYMSDEGSSGDEQMSIFTAMNGNDISSPGIENERSGFGSLLTNSKRHRSRTADKSMSGISFGSRGFDESTGNGPTVGYTRPSRRRNMSTSSNNSHFNRGSPRPGKPGNLISGFANLNEKVSGSAETFFEASSPNLGPSTMTRSESMKDSKAPPVELNHASLHHVRRLLRQLLQDANIPNTGAWEKALVPILLRSTDDVNPDVRRGDDIDIRHYVKLKKIPGGKPGDTSYVSGVVFTKNLALKSMPRNITHPRIVIVSFPIEYQRHQQHFMSLEPIIAQEREFLKNMVNRIASLRPHLVLVQKHISGLALQYLAEANIAVAYNVKQSVIEAVSRCAQTEIISSIDMVALKPVHVGKSACFDVKTYVHNDIPGRKKTCVCISGCPKALGCTIVLRGASMPVLSKMKRITEFMVYVVYNLKLETCLMRDEFVLTPALPYNGGSLSPGRREVSSGMYSDGLGTSTLAGVASDQVQPLTPASQEPRISQQSVDSDRGVECTATDCDMTTIRGTPPDRKIDCTEQQTGQPLKLVSVHESHVHRSHEDILPEDIPMPTFYSDMVAKHQTKILSASPFVRFMQPYLLMRAREQERRLVYLKRLRDQDTFEEQTESDKSKPQRFQLIQPEMVHETVRNAPKQIMEVLHAVHDAEYDKALHNYQTQKRQWENYIQGNLNLFDPHAHQNIVVLYTVVCTATTVPCAGPELLALEFYNEHEISRDFDPDCTLGQYVEDLCLSADTVCTSNGCERRMSEHHRTYVHGEARITVFIEKSPCKIKGMQDSILMWSYCRICEKETQTMPMSESTWKYSFGKYLELSFWSSELRLRAGICPHDLHRDHLRYFGYRNIAMRIHYDPIDLLEIVVPRSRITWKVDNDLRLKNDLFTKSEERWNRFMGSVKSRIKGINIDSVVPEKAEACSTEVEKLTERAQDEHAALLRKLQQKYMESKYYEIIPLNRAVRAMQEKVAEWDSAFADFDANYFPSEKDIRRLAALQLKKMFMDHDASTSSLTSGEPTEPPSGTNEKSAGVEITPSDPSTNDIEGVLQSVVEEDSLLAESQTDQPKSQQASTLPMDVERQSVHHLDLAINHLPSNEGPLAEAITQPTSPTDSGDERMHDRSSSRLPIPSSESSLSEKIIQLRKASQAGFSGLNTGSSETSGIPRLGERDGSRRSVMIPSPPISRTQSQPASTLRRLPPPTNKPFVTHGEAKSPTSVENSYEPLKIATEPKDRRLSDRLSLGTLKAHRKNGHSLIPRSIQSKRKDSRVSNLAKHFEELSREFEKERLRDRKQRAAKVTQSRAFPKASSKPIVEVYRDVNEAVEERDPSDDDIRPVEPFYSNDEPMSMVDDLAPFNRDARAEADVSRSPRDATIIAEGTAIEAEMDDNQPSVSQTASDDDVVGSDVEPSLLDDIPGVADIAESLRTIEPTADLDLPKHEKSSLMKVLRNFWAERSASGWTQLEYPLNASDHVFVDSDVIVREDEPSSLIAFALSSEDYVTKLKSIRCQDQVSEDPNLKRESQVPASDDCEAGIEQAEVETSLLRATGTHLKYQFSEGSAKMLCKIFYAEQFDAVRRKCGVADRVVESLSRCLKWDSKGGKTKSVFLKTLDDRLVLKSLSPIETQAFLRFAPAYFNIMAEALFHELPTVIAKMLGFFQIIIKNPVTGTEIKWDVLVMENLFYDRSPARIFDLKGSMRNRKIQSTGEQNEVLLDENMVEFIYESPLFAREHSKKLLRASVWNDTLFLARQNVMDYSLMVAVDESRKELVVGIIDCIRTYTWDKKLESWIKDRGFAGGGRNRPTVTSPKEYKSRFREAMARYVLQAPDCWHQFAALQNETRALSADSRNEPTEGNRTTVDVKPIA